MSIIPNIKEIQKKSDEIIFNDDAEKLKKAIAFVSNKIRNANSSQLKNKSISLPSSSDNPLGVLNKETADRLLDEFKAAGYNVKWEESHVGTSYDYDTEIYFVVGW